MVRRENVHELRRGQMLVPQAWLAGTRQWLPDKQWVRFYALAVSEAEKLLDMLLGEIRTRKEVESRRAQKR